MLFISGILGAAISRRYWVVAWTLLSAGGYLLLLCITFWDVSSNRFYIESEYMPLTIIGCTPFVYYVLPRLNSKAMVIVVLMTFCVRVGYICCAAAPFSDRVAIMEHILHRMKEQHITKLIIPEPVPGTDSALIMNWGAPVESMFLSALSGDHPQRTFSFSDEGTLKIFNTTSRDTFLGCWEKRGIAHINQRYFQIDTAATYQVMSYSKLMTGN
jgi:hypothetical protein